MTCVGKARGPTRLDEGPHTCSYFLGKGVLWGVLSGRFPEESRESFFFRAFFFFFLWGGGVKTSIYLLSKCSERGGVIYIYVS